MTACRASWGFCSVGLGQSLGSCGFKGSQVVRRQSGLSAAREARALRREAPGSLLECRRPGFCAPVRLPGRGLLGACRLIRYGEEPHGCMLVLN